MALPDDFLQELKLRCNITDVVSSYVNLKRSGRNMVGLCPFHGEKTPSFHVVSENGYFHCFGCGAGGDVITFIMKIENLDYIEAVRLLAQRAGLDMPENTNDQGLSNLRRRIYEANREAGRFYYRQLYTQAGKNALQYLRGRALSERTIRHFGLGYSPPSRFALVDHLKSCGFKDAELVQANLAVQGSRGIADRFFDRVIFPIIDLRGNVIAFGGRIMGEQKPKYLNTSDTVVFKKSANLFALNLAKNEGSRRLILAEGYMDVIALHQAGFTNAVATLGTSLTQEQATLMKRYADEVVICYDADEAGQKAAARAISLLRGAGLLIRILTVPGAKDPDEFIRENGDKGPAKFKQLLQASGNDVEYRLARLKEKYDLAQTEGRVAYLTDAAKLLSTLGNEIERDVYAGRLSDELGVQKDAIRQQMEKYSRRQYADRQKKEFYKLRTQTSARMDKINPQKAGHLRAAKAEEALIAYIMNNPDVAKSIIRQLPPDMLLTDFNRRVYQALAERIEQGQSAMLMDISAGFSSEENAAIAEMLSQYTTQAATPQAAQEYINTILSEHDKVSVKQLEMADPSDINRYLEKLRKAKQ